MNSINPSVRQVPQQYSRPFMTGWELGKSLANEHRKLPILEELTFFFRK